MNQFVKFAAAAAVSLVFLSGCSDPVSTVKDGTLPEFSTSMKVGDALGKYSGCVEKTAKWSKFSTDQIKSGVEFTCELKPSAELYAGIRKEAVDAKSGVQVLQAMADAFRAALGNGASQQLDMSKNIDTMIAATGVTKNELTVRFAINSDDKKKFDLSSVSTKFFWGKDSANLANPKDSLHAVYDNVPFVANTAGKEMRWPSLWLASIQSTSSTMSLVLFMSSMICPAFSPR